MFVRLEWQGTPLGWDLSLRGNIKLVWKCFSGNKGLFTRVGSLPICWYETTVRYWPLLKGTTRYYTRVESLLTLKDSSMMIFFSNTTPSKFVVLMTKKKVFIVLKPDQWLSPKVWPDLHSRKWSWKTQSWPFRRFDPGKKKNEILSNS